MNYLDKAKDYAVQWSEDSKGDQEFIFDKIGLEYFLDSLNIDFLAEQPKKEWLGLTNEEIMGACSAIWAAHPIEIGNVVQDLLKKKNGH